MGSYFKNNADKQQYTEILIAIKGSNAGQTLNSDIMVEIAQYATGSIVECKHCAKQMHFLHEAVNAPEFSRNYNQDIFCVPCCESNESPKRNHLVPCCKGIDYYNPEFSKNMLKCTDCNANVWRPWQTKTIDLETAKDEETEDEPDEDNEDTEDEPDEEEVDEHNMVHNVVRGTDTAFCANCFHVLCGACFMKRHFPKQCRKCITYKYYIDYTPYDPPYDPPIDDKENGLFECDAELMDCDHQEIDKKNDTEIGTEPPLKKRRYDDHSKNNDNADANQKK